MGSLFSRTNADAVNTRGPCTNQQTPRNTDHNMDAHLLQENSGFIQDLTDCGSFLDNLDSMLSGNSPIPSDVASQALVFDSDTLKSYIQALNVKAEQLRKIKLLLASRPNIPNADLMTELLKEVEPKLKAMSLMISRDKNLLANPGKAEGHQNEDACATAQYQPRSGLPGTSGSTVSFLSNTSGVNIRGNATQDTISGRAIQTEVMGSNRRQRNLLNPFQTSANTTRPRLVSNQQREPMFSSSHSHMQPMSLEEARGLSLIFSQSGAANSHSSLSDEDDEDDEDDEMRHRPEHQTLKSIEVWRNENVKAKPKLIRLDRLENILDSVIPLYGKMSSKNLQRIAALKFSGEEGTDMGALTREFFFITFEAVVSGTFKGQKVMVGSRGHLIPNPMVDCRCFVNLGRVIVHAVINGSKGLCGLSPAIVHYLVSNTGAIRLEDSHPPLSVEDVDDEQLRQLMEKYERAEEFSESEDESWLNWMAESNCNINMKSNQARSYVLQHVLLYYVFWKRLRQIQALEEGLKSVGLKQFLTDNPSDDNFSHVFPSGQNLEYTADALMQVLVTRGSDFHPEVWQFFIQFLRDLYNGDIDNFRLPDLVQFVTSSPYFPERFVVSFKDDIALPEAHACYNEIVLPTRHNTYPRFKEAMVTALENGLTGFQLQ